MIVDSFNQLAYDFVSELIELFPEEAVLKEALEKIQPGTTVAIEVMTSLVGQHSQLISAKDETVFKTVKIPGMSIRKMWKSLSDDAKNNIWQRLNAMVLIGTTMNNTPAELMTGIENLAMEFGEKLQNGELDMSSMMGEILTRVQGMDLSSLKNMNMDIGALTNSLGIDTNELTDMVGGMLGGVNPELMRTVTSLVSGQGEEEDLLAMLEAAHPPPRQPQLPPRNNKKKKHHRRN
jgi:hypothetical protein